MGAFEKIMSEAGARRELHIKAKILFSQKSMLKAYEPLFFLQQFKNKFVHCSISVKFLWQMNKFCVFLNSNL